MLKIHQPYIKRTRYYCTLAGIGVLLLGSLVVFGSSEDAVYAAGDSRTIHDIENMQDMTQQICSNTKAGDTAVLTDKRLGYGTGTMTGSDGSIHNLNQYVVVKLKDENCWMQENLRLGGSSAIGLKPSDTDIENNYTLPASKDTEWATSEAIGDGQIRVGKTNMTVSPNYKGDGEGWQPNYGNYYSWCAATAGTCDAAESNADKKASGSICPKNWHLPTGGTTSSEFYAALSSLNFTTVQTDPYKFPAAGFIRSDGLGNPGTNGSYWSSTSLSIDSAYFLNFYGSIFRPGTNTYNRLGGFSARCVATGGLEKIEKPLFTTSEDEIVNVNVPSILTIDAVSGMSREADATKVIEGTATATISSNTEYNVTLHSTQPALKDIENSSNTAEIAVVSSSNPVQPGNNSWGFWDGSGSPDAKVYALPITTTAKEFYNSKETVLNTDGGPATKHTYYVGISISPSLPSGVYATDVIITASVK